MQLDVRYLSLWWRRLVNAYEVKAGIGVIAGKTEHLDCEVLQKEHYITPLTFTFTLHRCVCVWHYVLKRSEKWCRCYQVSMFYCCQTAKSDAESEIYRQLDMKIDEFFDLGERLVTLNASCEQSHSQSLWVFVFATPCTWPFITSYFLYVNGLHEFVVCNLKLVWKYKVATAQHYRYLNLTCELYIVFQKSSTPNSWR